jgi:hypothetical protein
VPVAVPVGDYASEAPAAQGPGEREVRHDAITRQLMAARRSEREGRKLGRELERLAQEFDEHEREVVEQLRAAGYLRES